MLNSLISLPNDGLTCSPNLTASWQPAAPRHCQHCRHSEPFGQAIWCTEVKLVTVFSCWRFEREPSIDDDL